MTDSIECNFHWKRKLMHRETGICICLGECVTIKPVQWSCTPALSNPTVLSWFVRVPELSLFNHFVSLHFVYTEHTCCIPSRGSGIIRCQWLKGFLQQWRGRFTYLGNKEWWDPLRALFSSLQELRSTELICCEMYKCCMDWCLVCIVDWGEE